MKSLLQIALQPSFDLHQQHFSKKDHNMDNVSTC
jgi:hypothetical protein